MLLKSFVVLLVVVVVVIAVVDFVLLVVVAVCMRCQQANSGAKPRPQGFSLKAEP